MSSRRRSPRAVLLLPLLLALLAVPFVELPAHADPSNPAAPGSAAQAALAEVQELLTDAPAVDVPPAATAHDEEGHGKELTLALRDLALLRDDLPRSQRDDAARLLARPTDAPDACGEGEPACYGAPAQDQECNDSICVHYNHTGAHAVPAEDDGPGRRFPGEAANGVPDYVDLALRTVTSLAAVYTRAGYRAPLDDAGNGETPHFDVYLADLVSDGQGYYGYCAPDGQPEGHTGAAAYCVLENDYAEFGSTPGPIANLRVTAAHEYFHAVQFAYDVNEDAWLMEATATWVEDEVYDAINDNRFYLPYGQLGAPHAPLDRFSGLSGYGAWVFFRYLSERYPGEVGGLPHVVRRIWQLAAGSRYSVAAVRKALAERNTDMTTQFARFSAWNRDPGRYYSEGRAWPAAPLAGRHTLAPDARKRRVEFGLHHLAARTFRFTPSRDLQRGWRLRLRLNTNSRQAGGAAWVTVKPDGKPAVRKRVPLNRDGNATVTYRYGRARVDWVEVTAVNASTRYRCGLGRGWSYTCGGRAIDDGADQVIVATAYRP